MTITPQSPDASNGPLGTGLGVDLGAGAAGTPAGWYPDPAGYPRSRWWDGAQWTMHYNRPFDAPVLADPGTVGTAGATAAQPIAVTNIESVTNLWIWLAIVLPYAPVLFISGLEPLFTARVLGSNTGTLPVDEQLAMLVTPGLVAFFVVGFLSPWAAIYSSYRDVRWLKEAQVPRPFHWAWSLLILAGYPVYTIGRAIVTRRRNGQGFWVLWATIGAFALSTAISIVWSFSIVANAFS